MGREGPCSHCKIENSKHWRPGPPEKPVLCNTCGSRWAKKHQLNGYVPRHRAVTNYEVKQLLSTGKPPFSESNPQITASSAPVDQFHSISKVQRKKRSSRGIQKLTAQLYEQLQSGVLEEQFVQTSLDYDDSLIYKPNWMTASNKTLLGAVLLTPPVKE